MPPKVKKDEVQEALTWLQRRGTKQRREEMAPRYLFHIALVAA